MSTFMQWIYSILMLFGVGFMLYQQQQISMAKIDKLQFIGWLINPHTSNDNYYLFFHTFDKTFVVSPMFAPNNFYLLTSNSIAHGQTIDFRQNKYQVVLRGR